MDTMLEAAEVFPAGEYLRDELDERDSTVTEFAEILARPVQVVSEILRSRYGGVDVMKRRNEHSGQLGKPAPSLRSTTTTVLVTFLLVVATAACANESRSNRAHAPQAPLTSVTTAAVTTRSTSPSTSPSTGKVPAMPSDLNSALITAAWANDLERARDLVVQGADVNYEDTTEQSAYLIATSEGYVDLLELTLSHGADVAALDSYNGTGLIRAAERGHSRIVAGSCRRVSTSTMSTGSGGPLCTRRSCSATATNATWTPFACSLPAAPTCDSHQRVMASHRCYTPRTEDRPTWLAPCGLPSTPR